jgi:hypothetical protein
LHAKLIRFDFVKWIFKAITRTGAYGKNREQPGERCETKNLTCRSRLNKTTDMKYNLTLMSSLLAALVLAACGGGGGGSSPSTAANGAVSPSATSSPAAASAPATASAPTAASNPTVTGEALPSLTSPQAGSTAATGTGPMGIWSTSSGIARTTGFVDPQNNISYLSVEGSVGSGEFFGVASATSSTWTLTSGVQYFYPLDFSHYYTATSGSGSYVAKQAFSGSYLENGNTQAIAWTYDPANALAVTQADVAGTWTETGTSLAIGSDGTLSGTVSNCAVTGTLLLTTAGSNQNLYTMNLTSGASGANCAAAGETLSGNAAIVFLPISGSNLYQRTILFVLHSADNSSLAFGQVEKQ